MKKKLLSLAVILTVATIASISISAHGHGRTAKRYSSTVNTYSICQIDSCTIRGMHTHSNKTYKGHFYGDGHDYHDVCPISGCDVLQYHEHDGKYYLPSCVNLGTAYQGYCNVANCSIDGYHVHRNGRGYHH